MRQSPHDCNMQTGVDREDEANSRRNRTFEFGERVTVPTGTTGQRGLADWRNRERTDRGG